jgi:hypothetical protein
MTAFGTVNILFATFVAHSGNPPGTVAFSTNNVSKNSVLRLDRLRNNNDRHVLFSYLDSLGKKDAVDDEKNENPFNGHSFSWGGTSGGEEYQDQYGRTIARPSQVQPAEAQPIENAQSGFSLQYNPMQHSATTEEQQDGGSEPQSEPTESSSSTTTTPERRISSIQSLQDITVTNNPYYTIGKDGLQEGRRQQQQNGKTASSQRYRRSPDFDFEKESDKYLKFSSQRVGHDALQPVDRPTQSASYRQKQRPTESVMEESKPNTLFQSHNQANVLNARTAAEKPHIDMDQLNDVISSPSPFRFLGQPNPNFVVEKDYHRRKRDDSESSKNPEGGERLFFGTRKQQYQEMRPDDGL